MRVEDGRCPILPIVWPLAWVASSEIWWSLAFVQRLPTGSPPKPYPVQQTGRLLDFSDASVAWPWFLQLAHHVGATSGVRSRIMLSASPKMPNMLLERIVQQIGAPTRPCAWATLTIASLRPPRGWELLGGATWPSPRFQHRGPDKNQRTDWAAWCAWRDSLWGSHSAITTAMRTASRELLGLLPTELVLWQCVLPSWWRCTVRFQFFDAFRDDASVVPRPGLSWW